MEALSVHTVLGLIGLIILIGLAGELFLKKTGVPSVLFLIGLGVMLGPVGELADPQSVKAVAPYFGTLALLIILFDGGLNLHITKVLRETPLALLVTCTVFSLSVLATATFYVGILQGTWLHGFLLGAIVSGTAASIVIPVIQQLKSLPGSVKVLVSLESALVNVLVIVVALAFMEMLNEQNEQPQMIGRLMEAFVYALLLASAAGALWARLLAWLKGQPLSYMLTLAAILVLYDLAELTGANGAVTILLFGLMLGNMQSLVQGLVGPVRRALGYELDQAQFALDVFLKRLNEELSFLVRTFFYVLLGLILDFSALTVAVVASGMMLFLLGLGVRALVIEVVGRVWCKWSGSEKRVMTAMLPRGLATAVMAFLPANAGIPHTDFFPMYAVTVIVLSVLYMTVVLAIERRRAPVIMAPMPSSNPSEIL